MRAPYRPAAARTTRPGPVMLTPTELEDIRARCHAYQDAGTISRLLDHIACLEEALTRRVSRQENAT